MCQIISFMGYLRKLKKKYFFSKSMARKKLYTAGGGVSGPTQNPSPFKTKSSRNIHIKEEFSKSTSYLSLGMTAVNGINANSLTYIL